MYTIRINDDNTLSSPEKQRIVQKSKLVDNFRFIVNPIYNDYDWTNATVLLEYLTPISKTYKSEFLVLSENKYKEFLQYYLPIDTEFTKEFGDLELQLTFSDIDENLKQHIRKTTPPIKVEISPLAEWSNIIPDEALTALDQRIIMQTAQIKALTELATAFEGEMVDNLKYDEVEETLQLTANGVGIGDKVSIGHVVDKMVDDAINEELEDGLPVVDFGSGSTPVVPDDGTEDEYDNVIEF